MVSIDNGTVDHEELLTYIEIESNFYMMIKIFYKKIREIVYFLPKFVQTRFKVWAFFILIPKKNSTY